jgi:hypothetical protein
MIDGFRQDMLKLGYVVDENMQEANSEEHAISAALTIPTGTRDLRDALLTWNVKFTAELIDANFSSNGQGC